jgi:acetyl/propionyl-CoA carboxylase alpha subunit
MKDAVCRLAVGANYVGAGPAEFMVHDETGEFYFLEVNARLQVEHPVTEAITGLDLVELQLNIASGEPMSVSNSLSKGERNAIVGHAIEVRIVAENPAAGFTPSTGRILAWAEPRHPGIRVDSGFGVGKEISRFYDSMIAKVIAHGKDREDARKKLIQALLDFHILGVQNNIGFLIDVLNSEQFCTAKVDTNMVEREFGDWGPPQVPAEVGSLAANCSAGDGAGNRLSHGRLGVARVWQKQDSWRIFRR